MHIRKDSFNINIFIKYTTEFVSSIFQIQGAFGIGYKLRDW